jgi:hypothetical protein
MGYIFANRDCFFLEVQGQIMIPKVVIITFEQTGIRYGEVGLIRHHVGRLMGIVEHTGSMKARHAAAAFKKKAS